MIPSPTTPFYRRVDAKQSGWSPCNETNVHRIIC
ncbi:MAG: hypothetical protein CM15mP18_4300 [Methanobacteriota archaeon]|nr:MAG: hypothetical protein CM15mP18_4300 [Euryarchaeota archaeon]